MPEVLLRRGSEAEKIRFQFWGDEERREHLRGLSALPQTSDREIALEIQDPHLSPISADLYSVSRPRVLPLTVTLRPHLADQHPRLLVSPAEVPLLRKKRNGSGAPAWRALDHLLASWDLSHSLTPEAKNFPGPERLSGEDRVLVASLLHLVDPTSENRERARKSYLDYLAQTKAPQFEPLRIDTQAGETLFILCVGFDWLHDDFSPEEREGIRDWLFRVADTCWSHLGYERRDYAQAHFLGCSLGLLAFAFLFWETHPRSREWAEYLAGVLQVIQMMLPADGFYPHGINLWIYEYGFLLRWLELFRLCAGHDLWSVSPHWKQASRFRMSVTSSDNLLGLTFGDPQYRVGGDAWLHHLIGARTGSHEASALGDRLAGASHEGVDFRASPPRRRVYEFLYREEARPTPEEEPAVTSFSDGGQITVRSGDSLFCFRSGPPLGWQRYLSGEYGGYGHADPGQGAFLLLHKGKLVVSGPGPVYRRETADQGCPTVDGEGQLGDTLVWLPDFFPPSALASVPELRVSGQCVAVRADLSQAYVSHPGVAAAYRSLYLDLERGIAGSDRIRCNRERSIEWHICSCFPFAAKDGGNGSVFRMGPEGSSGVELIVFQPVGLEWESCRAEVVPGYTNDGNPLYRLSLSSVAESVEIVWFLLFRGERACNYTFVPGDPWKITGSDGLVIRPHGEWIHPEGFHADQA